MAVALCRLALGHLARHGRRAWRDDDGRLRMALRDTGVNAILVIRTVARDRGYRPCRLVEQGTDLSAVVGLSPGQRCGHDLAGVGVYTEMQLSPRPARAGAMFLDQPLAWPTQLQARTVHQQMHGLGTVASIGPAAQPWSGHL